MLWAAMAAAVPTAVDAHFKLLEPASWLVEDERGDPQKAGPCGGSSTNWGTPSYAVTKVTGGQTLHIKCKAAGLLQEKPGEDGIAKRDLDEQPYWHIERARVEGTRQIPVELIVNGQVVDKKLIEADGNIQDLQFEYAPDRSSWIAIRVFPAAHTNPIFVELDGKPIRASKKSAQWCLDAVDVCWNAKLPGLRESERVAAANAYEMARQAYRRILEECTNE